MVDIDTRQSPRLQTQLNYPSGSESAYQSEPDYVMYGIIIAPILFVTVASALLFMKFRRNSKAPRLVPTLKVFVPFAVFIAAVLIWWFFFFDL
jgi:amino acid transporter